mgnify:FL=1|nr:MAG TPA: hypothetical protein [Caudoviricetes sp.]
MNGKVFVGQKALSLTEYEKKAPISGVILWVDDENCYEAGDETGTVIEQDCPYASQQMADNLLATLQGYSYQGLEANGAKMSPIAELGDGMTVAGLYTQLAYQNIRFSTGEVMDMEAPGSDETLHEYKTEGETTKNFNHQIAQTRSLISKTSEEILLQVESEINGLSSSFSVQLQSITGRIDGLDGDFAEMSLTLDGLTVTDSTGKTVINGSMIQTSNLYVNAANINGTLTANQINLTGAITWVDLDSGVQGDINEAVNTANDAYDLAYDNQLPSYIKSTYISATEVRSPTISGGTIIGSEIYATEDGDTYAMMDGDSFTLMRTGSSRPRAMLEATDSDVSLVLGSGSSSTSYSAGRLYIQKAYISGFGNAAGIMYVKDNDVPFGIIMESDGTLTISADQVNGVPVRFG